MYFIDYYIIDKNLITIQPPEIVPVIGCKNITDIDKIVNSNQKLINIKTCFIYNKEFLDMDRSYFHIYEIDESIIEFHRSFSMEEMELFDLLKSGIVKDIRVVSKNLVAIIRYELNPNVSLGIFERFEGIVDITNSYHDTKDSSIDYRYQRFVVPNTKSGVVLKYIHRELSDYDKQSGIKFKKGDIVGINHKSGKYIIKDVPNFSDYYWDNHYKLMIVDGDDEDIKRYGSVGSITKVLSIHESNLYKL